jgi:hypothetical protein
MPAKPIELGAKQFPRKGDALAYLRDMLYRYDLGDRINAEDACILQAALLNHPESNAKIGAGVAYFSVRSAEFSTRCFWVNRLDGTTEKFSYKACIHG